MDNQFTYIIYFSDRESTKSTGFTSWLSSCNNKSAYSSLLKVIDIEPFCVDGKKNGNALKMAIKSQNVSVLSSLIVVIDYISINNSDEANVSRVLRELIIEYPEVKFVFDEFNHINKDKCYLGFLGLPAGGISSADKSISVKIPNVHKFSTKEKLPQIGDEENKKRVKLLLSGNNNLFDYSNLRNTIKAFFFSELSIKCNYERIQNSRNNHLAICVEEEKKQSLFNSYSLYAAGYRVGVITTATELERTNNSGVKPNIIVRDFDLQFEDKPEDAEGTPVKERYIDKIRGCYLGGKDGKTNTDDAVLLDKDINNDYWSNLIFQEETIGGDLTPIPVPVYFASQLTDKSHPKLLTPLKTYPKENIVGGFKGEGKGSEIIIYGISKPINGIYDFQLIPEVKEIIDNCRDTNQFETKRQNDNNGGGHSAAPFIYHIAESLISRARKYYETEKYLFAAVLSREALEVLNGFHKSLMWEAIHLHAISENALIMSQVGCEDKKLAQNLEHRLSNIKKEVERISGEKKKDANNNVLLQIFSDIRAFCREREHFDCADVALKRMVHEQHKNIKLFHYSVYDNDKKKELKSHWSIIIISLLICIASARCINYCENLYIERIGWITMFMSGLSSVIGLFSFWSKCKKYTREALYHFKHFAIPIICLFTLFVSVYLLDVPNGKCWINCLLYIISYVSMVCIIIGLLCKPMYVVYSLVTTRGSLVKFIIMLAAVMGLFFGTYYLGFFHNAGVVNNVDAPQIAYNIFSEKTICKLDSIAKDQYHNKNNNTIRLDHTISPELLREIEGDDLGKIDSGEFRLYKKTTPLFIISNTVETTLEQGATGFFAAAMADHKECNQSKKRLFRAIVLFHILISWIFLGVFISMLYQKFRNE